jgi:hypothetical protein
MADTTDTVPVSNKLCFMTGPYHQYSTSGLTIAQSITIATDHAKALWAAGVPTICPHTNTAHFDKIAPHSVFVRGCIEMIVRSDMVFMLPNWELSPGSLAEMEAANRYGIPATPDLLLIICKAFDRDPPPGADIVNLQKEIPHPETGKRITIGYHKLLTRDNP